jgi:hypothetical protein
MKLTESQKNDLLSYLLYEKYTSEFKVIDGLGQHPDGLNFEQWIERLLERS